jgi:TonB family protein
MPTGRLRCLLLFALLGTILSSASAAERWLRARTAHFEMLSSASESESRRILTSLEQFRANFLASFPFRGASEPRTTIVLFDSDRQFRPYKPLYQGRPKEVAGFFLPGSDEVTIAMTTDVGGGEMDVTEVIFHEYVHLLLHVRDARLPVWLNEGLAELYSTFLVTGKNVEFGAAKDRHVEVLSRSALLPLTRLFAVNHNSPDYNESHRAGIFYAQSWALTHFLVCGEDRSNGPKLARFIENVSRSGETEEGFREAFGADPKAFELALRRYFDGGRYYKRTVPALLSNLEVKFAPATDLERELALANLRWRVHHSSDTAYRAHELLRQHPTAPRPHELLAAVAAHEGEMEIALDHWRAAAELKSDNPFVYVRLVREALSEFHGSAYIDTRLAAANILELRSLAERALMLNPEDADALEVTALVETLAETFYVPAINRVQDQVLKMRNPSRTLLALAIIRWRSGDHQTASEIIDVILSQRRADMPTRSAANLLRTKLPGGATADATPGSPSVEITPEMLAARAAVALHGGKRGTGAMALLDQMMIERGTTAPRVRLDPVQTSASKSTPPDSTWASVAELRTRAAAGDVDAMFDVAAAHALGDGAEFSPALAFEWLQKAREAGHTLATVALPNEADADVACQFLRQQRNTIAGDALPPLDRELKTRIAATPLHRMSLVHRMPPRYPEEKRRAGIAGEAVIHFRVNPAGQPEAIRVAQASDPAFGNAAEECVRQWRFMPTIRDRVAVATEVEVPIRFRIEK